MWTKFYEKRVNSSYQEYFAVRYNQFLDQIIKFEPDYIIEEGCGIGSISRYLHRTQGIVCSGFDIDPDMIGLSIENTRIRDFYVDDIHNPIRNKFYLRADLHVTHGVLEHFTDDEILSIFERYERDKKKSIHYVPLDKYRVPSFGDERLLPYEHWLDLVNPEGYEVFNDGYDLLFYK